MSKDNTGGVTCTALVAAVGGILSYRVSAVLVTGAILAAGNDNVHQYHIFL